MTSPGRAIFAICLAVFPSAASAAERAVAVTFDDLPGTSAALVSNEVPALKEMTRKLLAGFREAKVPVAAFVNEGKLFVEGETPAEADQRIDVLRIATSTPSLSTGSSRTSCAARR